MSSLTGNLISSTYKSLLKIGTNNTASANLTTITDGLGNATALSLSTATASIAGDLVLTGTLEVTHSGVSTYTLLDHDNIFISNHAEIAAGYLDRHGLEFYSGSNFLDITISGDEFGDDLPGTLIAISDSTGSAQTVVRFQNHDTYTDGTVSIVTPLQAQSGFQATGSVNINGTGSINYSGSVNLRGQLSFNAGQGSFVLPSQPAPIPVVGSAYYSGSALYIYNGTSYLSVALG